MARSRSSLVLLFSLTVVAVGAACSELRVAPLGEPAQTEPTDAAAMPPPSLPLPSADAASTEGDAGDGGDPRAPIVLAGGRRSPADIAVRNGFVYWVEQGTATNNGTDGRLSRAAVQPCGEPAGCVTDLIEAGTSFAGLAVNAEHVYVAAGSLGSGKVERFAFASQKMERFAPTEDGARRIALEPDSAIWVNAGSAPKQGTIRRKYVDTEWEVSEGGVTIVGGLSYPAAVAISGQRVFFTERGELDVDGTVRACDLQGDDGVVIAKAQAQPRGIAVDKTFVYWVNRGDGTVHRARWDGADHAEIVTGAANPNAIAVDGDGIYWTESGAEPDLLDGRVRRADLDGSHAVTLAGGVAGLMAIAVDRDAVYVAARGTYAAGFRDGVILKLRKP